MEILIDTNVLIDYFAKRRDFYDDARAVIESCLNEENVGYIAAHSIMDINYILRRVYSIDDRKKLINYLTKFFHVIPLTENEIVSACEDIEIITRQFVRDTFGRN